MPFKIQTSPPPRPERLVRRLTKSKLHSQSSLCRLPKLHIVREPPSKENKPQRCGGTEVRPPENRVPWSRQPWSCPQVSRLPWAHGPGCKLFRRLRHPLDADKSPLTSLSFLSSLLRGYADHNRELSIHLVYQ